MSRPPTSTSPAVGLSRPPRICSSVVFPDPEAPTIASRSPALIATLIPRSTSSVTGPCRKLLCTCRVSSTTSVMTQRLRGLGARGAPRRIQRSDRAQQKRHGTHLQHVDPFHVRGQIAHEVHAGIEKVSTEQLLEPAHQRFDV